MKPKVGRPKGSKNKTSSDVREKFRELVEGNISNFQNDLDSLKPLDRLNVLIQLSKFVLPTLRNTEITAEINKIPPLPKVIFKVRE